MLRVMSYNTLFGGFDGASGARFELQAEAILAADPDILFVQEWKDFLAAGARRLFAAERRLERRALVAPAPVTGFHTAVLIKPGIEVLSFNADADHFHHAAAIAELGIPGFAQPVSAISVHLCPYGPPVRLREACYLSRYAVEEDYVLLGGDFNTVSPHDSEPDLGALPARIRTRYAGPDGRADRTTLAALEAAGLLDIGALLGDMRTPTVPGSAFQGLEFVPFRCDYLLATQALAARAKTYRVLRDEKLGRASDHYPVLAEFDLVPG